MANILFLDNFDSFTYNLVDQFRVLGHNVKIYRNDTNLEQVVQEALNTPDTILALSPGLVLRQKLGSCSHSLNV